MRGRTRPSASDNSVAAEEAAFLARGLMRVRAVRELTGISQPEIYRLCHTGTFRFRRLPGGRGMLIYRGSVEDFIREGLHLNDRPAGVGQ